MGNILHSRDTTQVRTKVKWVATLYCTSELAHQYPRYKIRTHLSEAKSQVANCLRQSLHSHGLVVCEAVVLRLDASVVNQSSGVRDQTAHRRSDVSVHLHDLHHDS